VRVRRHNLGSIVAVIMAALVLVTGFDLATYAATGDSLIVGKLNKSGATTTLTNTGRGPVLSLDGGKLYPPLKVNSKKKVANLNADSVDGMSATQLEPGIYKIVIAPKGPVPTSTVFHQVALPGGVYQATLSGIADNPTDSSVGTVSCVVGDRETLFANPSTPNYAALFAAQEDLSTVYGGFALLGTSALFTLPAGHHVIYSCTANAASGAVVAESPLIATLRKVSKVTTKSGPVWIPPAPRPLARVAH